MKSEISLEMIIYRNYFIKYNLYFIKIKNSLETRKFL